MATMTSEPKVLDTTSPMAIRSPWPKIEGECEMNRNFQNNPYLPYYEGNSLGQQQPSPSMPILSKFFKKNKVAKILDFYCGTGRNSIFLSKEGFEVYGFDASELAIRKANERRRKERTNVAFAVLEYQNKLPYKDDSFDAVIAVRALYQAKVQKIKQDIEEICRVIRSGGYLYIESDQKTVWEERRAYGQVRTSERGTYVHSDGNYYHYFTKRELRTFFNGYRIVRFYYKNRRFYIVYQKSLKGCEKLKDNIVPIRGLTHSNRSHDTFLGEQENKSIW